MGQISRLSLRCGHFVSPVFVVGYLQHRLTEELDKEVQGYYEDGMRVPDDVTLLWSDDKWVKFN